MSLFETPLTISGPFRTPRQMLANQEYGGHTSLHDDETARKLGFAAGPIEGPTHFSQFVPLLFQLWGQRWFESGCISAHYQNVCVEGDEVKAFVDHPGDAHITRVWAEKKDGTPVLTGTASIGPDHPETELDTRRARLRPPGRLVILSDIHVGDRGSERQIVKMDFDEYLGKLYPFSLNDKLKVITETCDWYTEEGGSRSPWGRAVIPVEMVSVLVNHSGGGGRFLVKEPSVGLFADLEIRLIAGPLFVGKEYVIDREVIALSESRRTESHWMRTDLRDPDTDTLVASMTLNSAVLKESYPGYQEALAAE